MSTDNPVTRYVTKRSVVIDGHKTSVSIEDEFWDVLRAKAKLNGTTVAAQISAIDKAGDGRNLSSAIRIAMFEYVRRLSREAATEHVRADLDRVAANLASAG